MPSWRPRCCEIGCFAPSILPLDDTRNVAIVLAVVWTVALVAAVGRRRAADRPTPPSAALTEPTIASTTDPSRSD